MKNFLAYHLYHLRYHKGKAVCSVVNGIFLISSFISGLAALHLDSSLGFVMSLIVFLFSVGWSVYDDFLKDALEAKKNPVDIRASTDVMNKVIETNSENGFWAEESIDGTVD